MESIALDSHRVLLEIDLASGEERLTLRDAEPFPANQSKIARIAAGDSNARKDADTAGAKRDSAITLRIPSPDLDSDETFEISLWFYSGDNPLVLISGPDALPLSTLAYVLAILAETLKETDWNGGRYLDIARNVKNMGLWVLHQRTREIEQSVRDALDDEEFSDDDYVALRDYPARLARVEAAARQLRAVGSDWESARPKESFGINLAPVVPDRFIEFVDEAADDAKEAVTRLSGLISSQQIVLSQRQAAQTARFQRLVTIVGTAIVVPGLVAAVFGANVGFQGRESSEAFWAMLLLMAGSALGSYTLIRFLETGAWAWIVQHKPMSWIKGLTVTARLSALAALAILIVVAGIVILVHSDSPESASVPQGTGNGGHVHIDQVRARVGEPAGEELVGKRLP